MMRNKKRRRRKNDEEDQKGREMLKKPKNVMLHEKSLHFIGFDGTKVTCLGWKINVFWLNKNYFDDEQ